MTQRLKNVKTNKVMHMKINKVRQIIICQNIYLLTPQ